MGQYGNGWEKNTLEGGLPGIYQNPSSPMKLVHRIFLCNNNSGHLNDNYSERIVSTSLLK